MNSQKTLPVICVVMAVCCCAARAAHADRYVAYSLSEARRTIKAGRQSDEVLANLGEITDPLAVVFDDSRRDLIVVGRRNFGERPVTLDDLVVALRAILKHETWPLVSIDKDEQTEQTGRQTVRFEGGIAGTAFGESLLDADVLLKKLGLGEISAEIWGVRSFFDRICDHVKQTARMGHIRSRFWFIADRGHTALADRQGVMVIENLVMGVETRFAIGSNGHAEDEGVRRLDTISREFAQSLSTSFPDLRQAHRELARLDTLFKLVALATGVRTLSQKYGSFNPDLTFWLEEYHVAAVQTPATYPLRVRKSTVGAGGEARTVELDGGVELRALLLELNDGSLTALRDIVTRSRPGGNPLTWNVPLDAWDAPGEEALSAARSRTPAADPTATHGALGCTLDGRVYSAGDRRPTVSPVGDLAMLGGGIPDFQSVGRLGGHSSNIGGVMLSGTATVAADESVEVHLAGGNFSLVVDGKNARIDPRLYRKFITALWCVYYSDQDPGISLDPPERDWDKKRGEEEFMKAEKHSVRYIGRVLNTDLARVMREADYRMKKWAVGTERANYPGFKSVDGYYASGDAKHVGIGRRFWFVPEDLRFRQGGGLLLFDRGRMRLNTEYDRDGMRGQASPADQAFADFFTLRYEAIADKHPVYEELFEYAKLVSLAKYLKQQGVPLYWFLMAHKDLVLTEDSPVEVDGLLKRSEFVRGLVTKGGVNLASTPSYRYDAEAEATINRMFSRLPAAPSLAAGRAGNQTASHIVPQKASFDMAGESYTVLPQHSVACNKDCRGVRYQTDLALRQQGRPGLELVRYFDPQRPDGGEFGRGWHLLIPYRVKPADDGRRQFQNVTIPERMVLDNLVSGAREVLTFTEEGERGVGYVPEDAAASQVVRLYLMSNASFRLTDKLGNQFQFDGGGQLTDMAFSPDPNHQVQFEYASGFVDAFDAAPYVVCPADRERVQFRGLRIPQRVKVTSSIDGSSEVLTFSDQGRIAGYVPDSERTSRYRLAALLTNTGVQLVDRFGNEAKFNPNWSFEGLLLSGQSGKIVRSVCSAGHKVTFRYVLDPSGKLVISSAALADDHPLAEASQVMRYEHDDHGGLCRVTRCKRRSASSRIDGSVDANEGLGALNANGKTARAANWKADWPAT